MSGRGQSHTELRQGRVHGATLGGMELSAQRCARLGKVDRFILFEGKIDILSAGFVLVFLIYLFIIAIRHSWSGFNTQLVLVCLLQLILFLFSESSNILRCLGISALVVFYYHLIRR